MLSDEYARRMEVPRLSFCAISARPHLPQSLEGFGFEDWKWFDG